jgi:signal transduction histidine kinase
MGLWSVVDPGLWSGRWKALSIVQQFVVAAGLAVGVNMVATGYWAEDRIYENAIASIAETGALYLEGFLAPHVQTLATAPDLDGDDKRNIDALVHNSSLTGRVEIIKVWRLDGSLVYSTDGSRADPQPKDELLRAAAGQVAVDFKGHDDGWTVRRPRRVEIYSPLYREGTKTPIAVGEFYENIDYLHETFNHYRRTMWIVILVFTISIIGSIYFIIAHANRTIGRQRAELLASLESASRLARRNDRLRRIADKARLNTSVVNETYLANIGADLHDGPMQVLSLARLKLSSLNGANAPGADQQPCREIEKLIEQTVVELRSLASGLVLPEIEKISLEDALRSAIARHSHITGTEAAFSADPLPPDIPTVVKVCCYRLVQEALNNAYKHAAGREQAVHVGFTGQHIEIRVSDGGMREGDVHADNSAISLGLRGLLNRVRALRGTLVMRSRSGGGTELRARIPLARN